jgi:hypothetical protein
MSRPDLQKCLLEVMKCEIVPCNFLLIFVSNLDFSSQVRCLVYFNWKWHGNVLHTSNNSFIPKIR